MKSKWKQNKIVVILWLSARVEIPIAEVLVTEIDLVRRMTGTSKEPKHSFRVMFDPNH